MPPAPPVTSTTRPDRSCAGISGTAVQLLRARLEVGEQAGQRLLRQCLLDERRHQRGELEIDGVGGVGGAWLRTRLQHPGAVVALHHLALDHRPGQLGGSLRRVPERPSKLSWTMIKGEMMKGNDGTWMLKAGAQPGTTDATYTIDLKLSSLVPAFIEKALAEQSLPGLLANFKARAEKLHGGA